MPQLPDPHLHTQCYMTIYKLTCKYGGAICGCDLGVKCLLSTSARPTRLKPEPGIGLDIPQEGAWTAAGGYRHWASSTDVTNGAEQQ